MELKISETLKTDVLVIGGGAAGLRAAISSRKRGLDVLLISESPVGLRNNTAIAVGIFAASGVSKKYEDSPEIHLKDTIAGGRSLNDHRLVEVMTAGAKQQVFDLIEMGVNFQKRDGELFVTRVPGHSFPRHVGSDEFRGTSITRPMSQYAANLGVKFLAGIQVTQFLLTGDGVSGVFALDNKGQPLVINAIATILATGGAGKLYGRTNNAVGSTGDGYALAYEVGASLRDMEFVQFYPTAYGKEGIKMCGYEFLLPAGATIRNSLGEDILKKHSVSDPTRDILARTIMKEIADGRGVQDNIVVDFTTIPDDKRKWLYTNGPMSREGSLRRADDEGKLLVAPTVHFFMGGVVINEKTETGIPGLYAAGEVCGGVHGANRLGGNAICECLVFGTIAGNEAATTATNRKRLPSLTKAANAEVERLNQLTGTDKKESLDEINQSLRQTMWQKVGVIRNQTDLESAGKEIQSLKEQFSRVSIADSQQLTQAVKLNGMLTVAEMICRSALTRTETRGAHYRSDYPVEDNAHWLKTIKVLPGGKMEMKVENVN